MTGRTASERTEIPKLPTKEKQLREALKTLFDLLEEYAPMWYTEEHREKARDALG